ncbi:MAG: hypothetical protein OHK0022_45750 [Roseiflexaceae bacterium]
MDNNTTSEPGVPDAPGAPGTPDSKPDPILWALPFPLPPDDERLEIERREDEREVVFRSGSVGVRLIDGAVVGVCVHRVWLSRRDVQALWLVLSAAVRAGTKLRPGEHPDAYLVAAPAKRVASTLLREGGAAGQRQRNLPLVGVRHRCERVQLTVRTSPVRHTTLDAFNLNGLDPAVVLRDLPAVLAVLAEEF